MQLLQEQYELLSKQLLENGKKIKDAWQEYSDDTADLRTLLQNKLDAYVEKNKDAHTLDAELREKLKFLFATSMELQQKAHEKAMEAYEKGDMAEVQNATLVESNASISTNGNVFFRTYTSFDVEDIEKIPQEFIYKEVNKKELRSRLDEGGDVPGVSKVKNISVVLKNEP